MESAVNRRQTGRRARSPTPQRRVNELFAQML
jgi:hypothetical protein